MRLLVAENDPALATFLHSSFDAEHYTVDLTRNGEEAKQMVEERSYDLAILDMNLALSSGMQVLQSFRAKQQQLPILVLAGRNRPEDRVEVLDMGADDLVLKPFSFSELSARVRALLRRGGRGSNTVLYMDDLELNRVEHSVKRASRGVELTPKEFALLEYLMRNAGQNVTRAQIIEHVWNLSFDTMTNVVDVYINYSSAQVDKRKAGQLAMAIQVAFQQMGIFDSSNSKPGLVDTEPMPFADVQMIENVKRLQAMGRLVNSPQENLAESPDRPNLEEVQAKLDKLLAPQIHLRIVSVTASKEGVVVSLREAGFFDSGSTALGPQALPTLSAIVKVIGPERMRIEGHTDNVPIHNARFDSNWELSTARATEIIKLFITKYAIAPDRLAASGYGEYYPVASNDTAEGRSMNRRVDLVILNSNVERATPTPDAVIVAPDAPHLAPR